MRMRKARFVKLVIGCCWFESQQSGGKNNKDDGQVVRACSLSIVGITTSNHL